MSLTTPSTRSAPHTGTPATERHATLAAAVLGFFVITLDATIVNVALPSIRDGLGGGITGLQWVVDGYTLMFAALLLSAGALSDRIGARRAFGAGLALFAAASAACGLAPTLGTLIAARFVQGAAAAVVMPTSMALIRHAYPDAARRSRAVAIWAMGGSVAAASGPVLGGLLTLASWRMIFYINLPIALVTLLLLTRTQPTPHHKVPFDWTGQITCVLAMGGLTYGAIEAGAAGLTSPRVLTALAIALVAFTAFLTAQARGKHPMVPLDMFRSRAVVVAVAVGFAFMIGFYGLPFLFSLYLQQIRGLSPLGAGIVFLPMMLISATLTPCSTRVVERIGARRTIVTGLTVMAAGCVILTLVPDSTSVWALALLLIPVGIAAPLIMPPTTALLLEDVSVHRAGTASGVFNTSRQVGGALAVAVFGALLAGRSGFVHGLHVSLTIAAVTVLAAAATTLLLRRSPAARKRT